MSWPSAACSSPPGRADLSGDCSSLPEHDRREGIEIHTHVAEVWLCDSPLWLVDQVAAIPVQDPAKANVEIAHSVESLIHGRFRHAGTPAVVEIAGEDGNAVLP